MFTANSMNCLTEALGLSQPGQAQRSISAICASLHVSSAPITMASIRSTLRP